MLFHPALKKTSALLAAMLVMAISWGALHLPGASLQMVTFAFLSSSALCGIPDLKTRTLRSLQMVCGAAVIQFFIGLTGDYPATEFFVFTLITFIILRTMPDHQTSIIVLLIGCMTLPAPPEVTVSLYRCIDIAFAGIAVLAITTISNSFVSRTATNAPGVPYTTGESAIITIELTIGFIIFQISKHEQFVWIMLTILFVHMAQTTTVDLSKLAEERISATLLGILLGGIYLAGFCSINYRFIYIVPFTGTLGFFLLYLKNDYFLFTLLFMFSITLFSDWILGTANRFNFTEVMFIRSISTATGGVILLCGKNLLQKELIQ